MDCRSESKGKATKQNTPNPPKSVIQESVYILSHRARLGGFTTFCNFQVFFLAFSLFVLTALHQYPFIESSKKSKITGRGIT
ncbi:hypothetical protein BDW59DRAFT_41973 [Aspergillus cavernicola]|uniref:Uncharacterized protein n=1 Tax=Aspergillus cavernicola TaxID=176166 RepID=A0ABR4ILJ5_9EURO